MFKDWLKLTYTILMWIAVVAILGIFVYLLQKIDFFKQSPLVYVSTGVVAILVIVFFAYLTEIKLQLFAVRKDIRSSVVPHFLNISPETNDLVEHAIELWRIETRLNKSYDTLPENQKELFQNSVKKLKRFLDKNDIEVVDYTGQKFNEGRNLEILSVDVDVKAKHTIVKETKEPTVLLKGQVVRKGKVIVLSNDADEFEDLKNE